MANHKNLLDYILKSQQEGSSESAIRESLKGVGWNDKNIDAAFESVWGKKSFLHLHLFHRHVPVGAALIVLILVSSVAALVPVFYFKSAVQSAEVLVPNDDGKSIVFQYGSWPALENANFFSKVKEDFIGQKASFIEADLSAMQLSVYQGGELAKKVPILSKGKSGSWWETPAGLYKVEGREVNHYSSFGHVYMPWSMQFQGNFFIHGWPHYDNGSPVPEGYSGGCIRLGDEDAKEVYSLASIGMPVLVYEDFLGKNQGEVTPTYTAKKPNVDAVSFLAADLSNNFVFTEKDSAEPRSIASITKLMTALVGVEYINVEREVSVDPSMIIQTSVPRLRAGMSYSVLDLLSVLLQESSNEAANVIPAPIGMNRFLTLMKNKAEAIGMKQSVFMDTSGVDYGNVSTAQDLFSLAKYLYYNRSFILAMTLGKENRAAYAPSVFQGLKNFNQIPNTQGLAGGKIGLNKGTGESMLSVFNMSVGGETRPVVIIVLGSKDSRKDVQTIYNFIQSNYEPSEKTTLGSAVEQVQ